MGRTHEALERAEKEAEKSVKPQPSPSQPLTTRRGPIPRAVSNRDGMECYQRLKANLLTRYPGNAIKTIIFCSTSHGDGSTTTAANFAATLAGDGRLKVLLVDANLRTPYLHDLFRIDSTPGLSDYIGNGSKPRIPMIKSGKGNLFVLPCGSTRSGPLNLFETNRFDGFLQRMREMFDYIILDAPPIPSFAESRVICPKVDGVILVVGAGKTRRQVAIKAKKELEEAGGKVLGMVINRRKYHIPGWIYKRL